MTRKCFAAIKSGQENMDAIEKLAQDVIHKPTAAYAAVKEILALASKWNGDFGDVDPAWQPSDRNAQAPSQYNPKQRAMAMGAFIQS